MTRHRENDDIIVAMTTRRKSSETMSIVLSRDMKMDTSDPSIKANKISNR